jgi:hypothetical protein
VSDYVAGAGALLLVLFVPGALVLVAARIELTWSQAVALVPVGSIGVVFVLAVWESALGLPFGPIGFWFLLVALVAVAALRSRRGVWTPARERNGSSVDADDQPPRPLTKAIALVLLGLAIVAASAIWVHAIDGRSATPPNTDSSRHSFFIARIARAETIEPSEVLTADGLGEHSVAEYYPLGLHASLAVAYRLGVPVATLMNLVVVLFAAVLFPIGMYALTRFLVPSQLLAAGFTAVIAVLVSTFPYRPIAWGGIPLLVGTVMVPIVVVVVAKAIEATRSATWAIAAALTLVALFSVHTSELAVALLLVFFVVICAPRGTDWRARLVDLLKRVVVIGALAMVMILPTLKAALGGVDERSAFDNTPLRSVGGYLGDLLTLRVDVPWRQGWLVVLSVFGIAVLLWLRRPAWVLATLALGVLATLAATSRDPVSDLVTFAWYRQPTRVTYNLALVVPVFVGVALATACGLAWRWSRTRWTYVGVVVVMGALVYAFVAQDAVPRNVELVRSGYVLFQPVARDEIAAFDYLGAHVKAGQTVLNDGDVDGSLWMYAFAGAPPVLALTSSFEKEDVYAPSRRYLRDHIGELATNARVRELVKRYGVRYVYFGSKVFDGRRHHFDLHELEATPGLREVFRRGGAHVFEVEPD